MKNYMMPPIPKGFVHVSGTWDKAFIIEDEKRENRFTWMPLNVCGDNLNEAAKNADAYDYTKEMIEKHGGIYLSTHLISKNMAGKPVSSGEAFWNRIKYSHARIEAENMCKVFRNSTVRTRLIYDWEYDRSVETISHLINQDGVLTNEQFEEYGLFGMTNHWTWTLTKYTEFSMVLKKGNPCEYHETVYANNEWFESPDVGFRVALIVF